MVSQFFIRRISYGTQTIDQQERPYKKGMNYLTKFEDWLCAQDSGNNRQDGLSYNLSNEAKAAYYESEAKTRYISTPRDLARFVNKDALHQAYFNAALLMLSGGARWTRGNPYGDGGRLERREAGFGTLGGPHILALVSEVATRALKIVWYQKWQVHLHRLTKTFARREHYEIDANRELLGLGGANVASGLSAGMVVNGSLSKNAVNGSAGARTQLSGLLVAMLTRVTLLLLTGLFEKLPNATLAAVVIAAVIELVDFPALGRLYRIFAGRTLGRLSLGQRPDFVAAVAAMLGVLIFDTLPGLFIGIGMSLLLLLYRSSRPHVATLGQVPGTPDQWTDIRRHPDNLVPDG